SGYHQSEREKQEMMSKQEQLLDELSRVKADFLRLQAENFTLPSIRSSTSEQSTEHYKAAAKASEQALEELSKAFEQYREQVEASGSVQYEQLYKELEETRNQLMSMHQKYESDVGEYQGRLATLEQIEQQLREHGNMRLEDVARLQDTLLAA